MNKFNIGDMVVNKVSKQGRFGFHELNKYSIIEINGIMSNSKEIIYICGSYYYEFKEEELMSVEDYYKMNGDNQIENNQNM